MARIVFFSVVVILFITANLLRVFVPDINFRVRLLFQRNRALELPLRILKAFIFHGSTSYWDLEHRCSYSLGSGVARVLCKICGQRFVVSFLSLNDSRNKRYLPQIKAMIVQGCNNGSHSTKRMYFFVPREVHEAELEETTGRDRFGGRTDRVG